MPTEHVYGNYTTVHDGDLAVLRLRTADELSQLPPSHAELEVLRLTETVHDRVDVLRRRHQLLSAFAEGVRTLGNEVTDETFRVRVVDELRVLRGELERLPLTVTTNHGGDLVPGGPGVRRHVVRTMATGLRDVPVGAVLPRASGGADGDTPDDENPTETTGDDATEADEAGAGLRRVQLRVALGWERDGGQVVLGVDGYDHERDVPVDLGGLRVSLGWTAANRLLRKVRAGRDQSCGTPE